MIALATAQLARGLDHDLDILAEALYVIGQPWQIVLHVVCSCSHFCFYFSHPRITRITVPSLRAHGQHKLLSLNCIGPFPIGFDILARDACPSTLQIERHDWDISKILSPFWNVTEILTAELVGTIRGAPVAALSHR